MTYSNDLVCHAISGLEGIGQVFTANLTYEQFCTFFDVADTNIMEADKMQRDTAKSRVNGIAKYLTERQDTVFPAVTCVTNALDFKTLNIPVINGISEVGVLTLKSTSQRHLVDGQGRRLGVEAAIKLMSELQHRTIDIKFISTNSDSLEDSKMFVRQIFSDYHKKVTKPNSSINLFFDSSESSSTFSVSAFTNLCSQIDGFEHLVSVEGNTSKIWTLAQFKTFLRQFTGMSDKEMNECMSQPDIANVWLELLVGFWQSVSTLDVFTDVAKGGCTKTAKATNLLCCAIGIESLGMLANQIISKAIKDQTAVNWNSINQLSEINFTRGHKQWLGCAFTEEGKIIKGSAKRIATSIACDLGITLSRDFMLSVA